MLEQATLTLVLQRLDDWASLGHASLVCREWYNIILDLDIWHTIDLSGDQDASKRLDQALQSPQFRRHAHSVNLEFSVGITDEQVLALRQYNFKELNLNGCQRLKEETIISVTSKMPRLKILQLYWVVSVRDSALLSFATYNRHLEVLNLSGCKYLGDEGFRILTGSCAYLVNLDLTRCMNLTPRSLVSLRNCRNLEVLRLYACSQVTDSCLQAFSELRNLHLISLSGANLITDEGLIALAQCSRLRCAELSWCTRLTDRGTCALASGCQDLEILSLHGILGITNNTINALAENCPSLHSLDINGCVNVQNRSREELKQKLPLLKTFILHT